jgi:hypothetical protein
MRGVIEEWGSQVKGGLTDGLPEGIFDFHTALNDEVSVLVACR